LAIDEASIVAPLFSAMAEGRASKCSARGCRSKYVSGEGAASGARPWVSVVLSSNSSALEHVAGGERCSVNAQRRQTKKLLIDGGIRQMRNLIFRSMLLLTALAASFSLTASAQAQTSRGHIGPHERRELRSDRREIRGDSREIRGDRRETRSDRHDLRADARDYRRDRRDEASQAELRADRREIRGDRRELSGDWREARADRRDRRFDVRDYRRDRRDARRD
jgi:hypothetical protein